MTRDYSNPVAPGSGTVCFKNWHLETPADFKITLVTFVLAFSVLKKAVISQVNLGLISPYY